MPHLFTIVSYLSENFARSDSKYIGPSDLIWNVFFISSDFFNKDQQLLLRASGVGGSAASGVPRQQIKGVCEWQVIKRWQESTPHPPSKTLLFF